MIHELSKNLKAIASQPPERDALELFVYDYDLTNGRSFHAEIGEDGEIVWLLHDSGSVCPPLLTLPGLLGVAVAEAFDGKWRQKHDVLNAEFMQQALELAKTRREVDVLKGYLNEDRAHARQTLDVISRALGVESA